MPVSVKVWGPPDSGSNMNDHRARQANENKAKGESILAKERDQFRFGVDEKAAVEPRVPIRRS